MKNVNLEELRTELNNNFLNNKIDIELTGDITYRFKIENATFLLNKIYLILSDNEENQLNICLDEVAEIEVKERLIDIYFKYEQKIRLFT